MSVNLVRRFNDSLRDGGITDAEIRKGWAAILWILILAAGVVLFALSLAGVMR